MTAALLDSVLARWVQAQPEKPCIVVPDGAVLTYGALDRAASSFARSLVESGAAAGERLVLANSNRPEFFIALFGAARAGLVVVPVDAGLATGELENLLRHSQARGVVVDERTRTKFEPLGRPLYEVGPTADDSAATPIEPRRSADDLALLLYTSGTTGTPKGAMHSHRAIMQKLADVRDWFGFDDSCRALCFLPTHHGHGLVCVCLATIAYGGTLVLTAPFNVEVLTKLFELVERHGINAFSSVPAAIRLMLRVFEGARVARPASLRFVTCASAPLHASEVAAFEALFEVPLLNCYGLTEACTWVAMSPRPDLRRGHERDPESIGVAYGNSIRTVDDARHPLPAGATGELQVSGPSIMLGYLDAPEATSAVLDAEGWLSTGDVGRVDDKGRVYLSGRKKEIIIRAGVNVHPVDVEGVLIGHPDVAEAYVLGLDDAILGEKIGACVVPKSGRSPTASELRRHCSERLASYKCPEIIKLVESVPKTSRGKVVKAQLKALF